MKRTLQEWLDEAHLQVKAEVVLMPPELRDRIIFVPAGTTLSTGLAHKWKHGKCPREHAHEQVASFREYGQRHCGVFDEVVRLYRQDFDEVLQNAGKTERR